MTMMRWYQDKDFVDRLGRSLADIFVVLLALFFLYGYLGQLLFGWSVD